MSEQQPPKIEFPCAYPIKILGKAEQEFHDLVIEVMDRHAFGYDKSLISVKESGKGTFRSITVTIEATGIEQLQAIFDDLKDHELVRMVL